MNSLPEFLMRFVCLSFGLLILASCQPSPPPAALEPEAPGQRLAAADTGVEADVSGLVSSEVEPIVITMIPSSTAVSTAVSMAASTLVPTPLSTPMPVPVNSSSPTSTGPAFENPRNEALALLADAHTADFIWLNAGNTGVWQYAAGSFFHPLAIDVVDQAAYLLDGGRILKIDLSRSVSPELLLAPGDDIDGVHVLEPLDLAATGTELLVLDRAGDVYHADLTTMTWHVERYDRPIGETSSHYYIALSEEIDGQNGDGQQDGRYLLETSYNFTTRYTPAQRARFWNLPETAQAIDVSNYGDRVYVLTQEMETGIVKLTLYQDATTVPEFTPPVVMTQPRQVAATETAVYVLDQAGRRLLAFEPLQGELLKLYQLPESISAFWVDTTGLSLVLAGRERLYFYGQPERAARISGGPILTGPQPHDTAVLATPDRFLFPVAETGLGPRDLRMPGAPRHYRLGIHEGFDFYWRTGTLVRAVADGLVIRADHDYEPPPESRFNARRRDLLALGYTPNDSLDFYRGMQVWIQHQDGTVARYAHLSRIYDEIMVGTAVARGQRIGEIGNSGTPSSLHGPTVDAHLHFELWVGDHYFGQYLRPIEIREWAEHVFVEE